MNSRRAALCSVATTLLILGHAEAQTGLDQDCTVSVLNRNVRVGADGSWVLPNVPANFGQVRARATCIHAGLTVSGESDLFSLATNGVINLPEITLGISTPIPVSLRITPAHVSLTSEGQTSPLVVKAIFADGSETDVTAADEGTTYTTSNPALVSIDAEGVITAVASGTVVIQATQEGASGLITATVALSTTDTDGDGLADDLELTNGLDPNNPTDAFEDFDRDGLTNKQEILEFGTAIRNADTDGDGIRDDEEVSPGLDGFITSPLTPDTDGDGFRDGLEIAFGSDPTNPASWPIPAALTGINVSPPAFVLTVNAVIGVASTRLHVIGHLADGFARDLTSIGTNYSSSNLSVCSFGGQPGEVFAGANGTCVITATNNGFSAQSDGTVRSFSPTPLSFVSVPGFANNVDVTGDFAFVASGATGIQVVNVTNRSNPSIVAAFDTPGNANDVKVFGNALLIADGSAGLRILDVTNPLMPAALGSVDTPGDAQDVSFRGNLAFVADGAGGLQIIDLSNLSAPTIVSSFTTPGPAKGVDVALGSSLAAIAEGVTGLQLVDISNPANPLSRGAPILTGDARDVILSGNFAFVADLANSLVSVGLTDPDHPVIRASTPRATGGLLMDVAQAGPLVVGADIFFVNGVPIISVSNPAAPVPNYILNFSGYRDDNGTGIAVDNSYVYLTADLSGGENGTSGNSRLYIGQYLDLPDTAGIPPDVEISAPAPGSQITEGQTFQVTVDATDDVAVAFVQLSADGELVSRDSVAPYQFTVRAPVGADHLVLRAQAVDRGNNTGTSADVTLIVVPAPGTTVVGTVVDATGAPVTGAIVDVVGGLTGSTDSLGRFSIPDASSARGAITAHATYTSSGVTLDGLSAPTAAVPDGTTDVGAIRLGPLFGDGHNGALTASSTRQVVNVAHRLVQSAAAGATQVVLDSGLGLAPGNEVLVIQMQGATAGVYEFGSIASISNATVNLIAPLRNGFNATSGIANVVSVPNFTNVTVPSGTSLTANAWNGATGGIVVFRASGSVEVQPGGKIDVNGLGFRGGRAITNVNPCNPAAGYQGESILGPSTVLGNASPNVGGGGAGAPNSCVGCGGDSPAGGGGYGTPGEDSVNPDAPGNAGRGGRSYGTNDLLSALYLGSGGGESHWGGYPGGNAGGIVAIFARQLNVSNGEIDANGQDGSTAYGHPSGAGSGGSILLLADTIHAGFNRIHAKGGVGSEQTPCTACCGSFELEIGGDGGFGRILWRAREMEGTTSPESGAGLLSVSNWIAEDYVGITGDPGSGWSVSSDGRFVTETANSRPTVFYSDVLITAGTITATVRITGGDDDFFGLVLGFDPGETSSTAADYVLVDWKQQDQVFDFGFGGVLGKRGLAASRVFGRPYGDELWAHINQNHSQSDLNNGLMELSRGATLGNASWAYNQDYRFRFVVSQNSVVVSVNDTLEFEIPGNFIGKRFGFYDFSQPSVVFSNVTTE